MVCRAAVMHQASCMSACAVRSVHGHAFTNAQAGLRRCEGGVATTAPSAPAEWESPSSPHDHAACSCQPPLDGSHATTRVTAILTRVSTLTPPCRCPDAGYLWRTHRAWVQATPSRLPLASRTLQHTCPPDPNSPGCLSISVAFRAQQPQLRREGPGRPREGRRPRRR